MLQRTQNEVVAAFKKKNPDFFRFFVENPRGGQYLDNFFSKIRGGASILGDPVFGQIRYTVVFSIKTPPLLKTPPLVKGNFENQKLKYRGISILHKDPPPG